MNETKIIDFIEMHEESDVIAVPNFETKEEAFAELNSAEAAYFRYKKMYVLIIKLDLIVNDLEMNTHEFDLMTEEDHCDDLDRDTMDAVHILKDHIKAQAIKFKNYCNELEKHT